MTNNQLADYLQRFQDWRTGKDERTMDESGIVPKEVTKAIDMAIERLRDIDNNKENK